MKTSEEIKHENIVFELEQRLKRAEKDLRAKDKKLDRLMEVAYSDKPVAFRMDRVRYILRESEDKRRRLGH